MKKRKNKPAEKFLIILGERIDPINYPILYKWAKENPETLKTQLKSIADAWHGGSLRAAKQALESDLQHG